MARSMGLHLSGGAPRRARSDLLRDLLAGVVLLAAWGVIWAFLLLGVAGPLGALQHAVPQAAVDRRA